MNVEILRFHWSWLPPVTGETWLTVDQIPIVALNEAMGLDATNHMVWRADLDRGWQDAKYGDRGMTRWLGLCGTHRFNSDRKGERDHA